MQFEINFSRGRPILVVSTVSGYRDASIEIYPSSKKDVRVAIDNEHAGAALRSIRRKNTE